MAIVVIGGHSRNIGKTSVMASILLAMPEKQWTAIKITQYGHGVCSANGEACDCETADHAIAVTEERDPASGTDTSRYLAAGAARSLWVRTRQGQLAEAMPRLRREIAAAQNVLIESNSVLRFLQPDFFASVLDPEVADFKKSALTYLDRADALLMPESKSKSVAWRGVSFRLIEGTPRFKIGPPAYFSADFVTFLRRRLSFS